MATAGPDDELDRAPMADGGPGFVDVLNAALGGELLANDGGEPIGRQVPATLLLVDDTAYVESAQACGLHLTGREAGSRPRTLGVGQLLGRRSMAPRPRSWSGWVARHQRRGAGMLAALGATADAPAGRRERPGCIGRDGWVDLARVRASRGSPAGRRQRRGQPAHRPVRRDQGLRPAEGHPRGAAARGRRVARAARGRDRPPYALEKGAGAAGGLGFALLALGAAVSPGSAWWPAVRLAERARPADLVVTGEGAFDFSSRSGKVPYGVAEVAAEALRPCVAIAGQVLVGSREMRALGVESAYSLVDLVGRTGPGGPGRLAGGGRRAGRPDLVA